jgi:hypothetical protein
MPNFYIREFGPLDAPYYEIWEEELDQCIYPFSDLKDAKAKLKDLRGGNNELLDFNPGDHPELVPAVPEPDLPSAPEKRGAGRPRKGKG